MTNTHARKKCRRNPRTKIYFDTLYYLGSEVSQLPRDLRPGPRQPRQRREPPDRGVHGPHERGLLLPVPRDGGEGSRGAGGHDAQ